MGHGTTPVLVRTLVLAGTLGMLVGLLNALGAEPEYPSTRLGVRTAPLVLLSRPDVRAELALTPHQASSAEQTLAELHARAASLKGKTGPEVVAARRAIDEAQQHWLETQLSAGQLTRLAEIDLQWEGPPALVSRPGLADALSLSPDQRTKLARLVTEHEKRQAQAKDQHADPRILAQQTLAVLSSQQQNQWRTMLGRPFTPQVASGTPRSAN